MSAIVPEDGLSLQHEHFMIDANLRMPLNEESKYSETMSLVADLLIALGMSELGKLELYSATDLRAPGWSFIQPITTSHISAHYFEKPGLKPHIHMDIYSCMGFDWRKAIEILERHCKIDDWYANFFHRDMELRKRTVWMMAGIGNDVQEVNVLSPTKIKLPVVRKQVKVPVHS
ncbi:MAG: hypothetical protein Q7R81_03090 [Candidatus Peregrinibacteria bacterium]|nr:hypothetical protein [Candidatus Peregrinibacteria bacterium]